MTMDEMLVELVKTKIKEVTSTMMQSNFSKGYILQIVETASKEVEEEIKDEMWDEAINGDSK